MWQKLGKFILQYRLPLLIIIVGLTAFMTYKASKVELSYEFTRAIPVNHPANVTYQEFRQKYGQDGNMLVVGIQTDQLFSEKLFNNYTRLHQKLKQAEGVTEVISVPSAVNLMNVDDQLQATSVFPAGTLTKEQIDSSAILFKSLPFYRGLLYNPETNTYMMGVSVDKDVMNTKKRNEVVENLRHIAEQFGTENNIEVHLSGLPLIRTELATRVADEMKGFLLASVVLSALILLLFFRSVSAMLLSLGVVIIGVIWVMGTMVLFEYKISLLTALIPPLIVVIGIPNCIYFLNKYHTAFLEKNDRKQALITMVGKMGIVTLFCNLAAAIGFAVFGLTESALLKEFGIVAGINIMALFFLSLTLIPIVLSYLPNPKSRHIKYLNNPRLHRWLSRLERWSLNKRKLIYSISITLLVLSAIGIARLKSVGYIVDDLPKSDKIYTDLKFFETHFKGVMPLEIVIDTRKKYGVTRNLGNLSKIDELANYVATIPDMARPLSLTEGMKFAKQAMFFGDSNSYTLPSQHDLPALAQYLKNNNGSNTGGTFGKLLNSFIDSNSQETRISISMADIGSLKLPPILDSIQLKAEELFNGDSLAYARELAALPEKPADIDSSRLEKKANILLTGTSITFLEGSRFIINGLAESIFWAFLLITLCMLYLFKSFKVLICSLIPNVIPLVITAGVMGWIGIPLKPSTVLVFSVALGIAIDITIRFLVNYKQELPYKNFDIKKTVVQTIHSTGISIIYTSLVLIAGFVIFGFSSFGGTKALGWLTSLTLVVATLTNLVLLPALLLTLGKKQTK